MDLLNWFENLIVTKTAYFHYASNPLKLVGHVFLTTYVNYKFCKNKKSLLTFLKNNKLIGIGFLLATKCCH